MVTIPATDAGTVLPTTPLPNVTVKQVAAPVPPSTPSTTPASDNQPDVANLFPPGYNDPKPNAAELPSKASSEPAPSTRVEEKPPKPSKLRKVASQDTTTEDRGPAGEPAVADASISKPESVAASPTAEESTPKPAAESMLPPSAQGNDTATTPKAAVDTLLPPGASAGAAPATQVPLPSVSAEAANPSAAAVIPTEDGRQIALQEPVKTVGHGDEEVELRQLSAEEKASRRLRRKIVMWTIGLIIIVITMGLLLWSGPITMN